MFGHATLVKMSIEYRVRVAGNCDAPSGFTHGERFLKALRFTRTGDLKYLEQVECPAPKPAQGEVLIAIRAAGLNRSDLSNVRGSFSYTTLPRTPGRDFSGVVVQGPDHLIGKAVWGAGKDIGFTRDGSHAQYLTLPADAVAIKPQALSFVQAASCGVPYVTAWHALESTGVTRGTKLLVVGASGAVGDASIQLGRWRGAQVLGAVRHARQASSLAAEGTASMVLPSDAGADSAEGAAFSRAVNEKFPGGADVIFDTTGYWLPQSVAALGGFGRIAVIVAPGNGDVVVPIRELYRRGGAIVGVNSLLYSSSECARLFDEIGAGFDSGELRGPRELHEHPLSEAIALYESLGKGLSGKHVFVNE